MRTPRPSKLIICKLLLLLFLWWSYNKNNSLVTIYFKFWSNKIKLRHIILSLRIFQIFCIFVKPKNLVQQPSLWLVSSNITTHQFIVWLKPTLHKWLGLHTPHNGMKMERKRKKTFLKKKKKPCFFFSLDMQITRYRGLYSLGYANNIHKIYNINNFILFYLHESYFVKSS